MKQANLLIVLTGCILISIAFVLPARTASREQGKPVKEKSCCQLPKKDRCSETQKPDASEMILENLSRQFTSLPVYY